jgi:glycosyltransferase involved in cell wall biosynthesis
LLHALAICRQRGTPCRAVVAGTGPEQPRLEELANSLDIGDAVTFAGRLSSTDMPAFYAGIDVLVLPSRTTPNWKEQFGRVLIEAMACERTVLGSDSGEIPHVIGEAGWVFSEGNTEGLAEHLQRLAEDANLRARLGRQGRQRVLQHYTQQRIAAATYEVYRQTLAAWAM